RTARGSPRASPRDSPRAASWALAVESCGGLSRTRCRRAWAPDPEVVEQLLTVPKVAESLRTAVQQLHVRGSAELRRLREEQLPAGGDERGAKAVAAQDERPVDELDGQTP